MERKGIASAPREHPTACAEQTGIVEQGEMSERFAGAPGKPPGSTEGESAGTTFYPYQ